MHRFDLSISRASKHNCYSNVRAFRQSQTEEEKKRKNEKEREPDKAKSKFKVIRHTKKSSDAIVVVVYKETLLDMKAKIPLMKVKDITHLQIGKLSKVLRKHKERPNDHFLSLIDCHGTCVDFELTKDGRRQRLLEHIVESIEAEGSHSHLDFAQIKSDIAAAHAEKAQTLVLTLVRALDGKTELKKVKQKMAAALQKAHKPAPNERRITRGSETKSVSFKDSEGFVDAKSGSVVLALSEITKGLIHLGTSTDGELQEVRAREGAVLEIVFDAEAQKLAENSNADAPAVTAKQAVPAKERRRKRLRARRLCSSVANVECSNCRLSKRDLKRNEATLRR